MKSRVGHIILALLLFVSSTGFVLNKHYCRNELKSMAIFLEAKGCHQANAAKPSCPMHPDKGHSHSKGEKKDCCKDESEFLKTDDHQAFSMSDLPALQAAQPVLAFLFAFSDIPEAGEPHLPAWRHFKPPIVCDNLQSRLQTFRL